jgi:hypothetical protein
MVLIYDLPDRWMPCKSENMAGFELSAVLKNRTMFSPAIIPIFIFYAI